MIAHGGMVTGETQDVVNAQHGSAQQFGLQCDPVPVTAGQLQDGGQAGILQCHTGRQAAHTHDGGLVVRHIHSGDAAQILSCFLNQMINVDTLGRANFCGHNKLTVIKQFSNSHFYYS